MLSSIVNEKKQEVKLLNNTISKLEITPNSLAKVDNFLNKKSGRVEVIAELKKASPVKGILNAELNLIKSAKSYEDNGAMAISVITDKTFFKGDPSFLPTVKSAVNIPILRKDFIIDEIQLYETLALGADLVLIIASILSYKELLSLIEKSINLSLEPLVEIHTEDEAKMVRDLPVRIIGINNRNLNDFTVDIKNSLNLADYIPDNIFKVSESGIKTPYDLKLLAQHNFDAALVGEALVTSNKPGEKLQELLSYQELVHG